MYQLLGYVYTNPKSVVHVYASNMIPNMHLDARYVSARRALSRAGEYIFLCSMPCNGAPIQLNGNIVITCTMLDIVAASAAEAELGALFVKVKEASAMCLILSELGHPQLPKQIHSNNTKAVRICNSTIKR